MGLFASLRSTKESSSRTRKGKQQQPQTGKAILLILRTPFKCLLQEKSGKIAHRSTFNKTPLQ